MSRRRIDGQEIGGLAWKTLLVTVGILVWTRLAPSQNVQLRTKNNDVFPTLTFTLVNWGATPPYYSIAIDSTGAATYQSAPESAKLTGAPYIVAFQATPATRNEIFDLAGQLHYFKGRYGSSKTHPDHRSIKTLRFHDEKVNRIVTYRAAKNRFLQQLEAQFQRISATLEFGRQLSNLHRSGDPGLETVLKRMQIVSRKGGLLELQAVAPVLQEIATDKSIKVNVRRRAESILRLGSAAATSRPSST